MGTKTSIIKDTRPSGEQRVQTDFRHQPGITHEIDTIPDHQAEHEKWARSLEARNNTYQFITPAMLTEAGDPEFKDPIEGITHARIDHIKWLERNSHYAKPVMIERARVPKYFERSLGRLQEARKASRGHLREAFNNNDFDAMTRGFGRDFLPIPGPYSRTLSLWNYWDMVARAFDAYNNNPVAHGIVDIKTAFTVGQGMRITAEDPEVQDFLDNWQMLESDNTRLPIMNTMLSLNGELQQEPWLKEPGHLSFVNIDPPTIWEFITNPRNINQRFGVWLQYQTQVQIKTERADGGHEKTSEYVMELLPPERILSLNVNCHENEKRGRTDLFSILGWLKWVKEFYFAKIIRAQAEATFTFDHLVKGNGGDVRRVANKYTQMPKYGSVFFHNENEARTLSAFNGAAAQKSEVGDELINLICVGGEIPKEYIGLGDRGGRAQAVVATDPFGKGILQRRMLLESLKRRQLALVLKEGVRAGKLSKGLNYGYELSWDELSPESTQEKIDTLRALQQDGVISHQRYAMLASQEINISDYNYDAEQAAIDQENQKKVSDSLANAGLNTTPPEGMDRPTGVPPIPATTDPQKPGTAPVPAAAPAATPKFPPPPKAPIGGKKKTPPTNSNEDRSKIKDEHRTL